MLLVVYYFADRIYRNYILLLASLVFYSWGEPKYLVLLVGIVLINYGVGLCIHAFQRPKIWLTVGIIANLCTLGFFKYRFFVVHNINTLFGSNLSIAQVVLPLGISFYIFQALSYIIDVYRGHGKVQKNLANLMLYISLFPQLIAGPIVRYADIDKQLTQRKESVELFSSGITRFIIGLSKKVILANSIAVVADKAFTEITTPEGISVSFAWIGVACYMLQIYFDFSGYSDMAIGLGRMFGFRFLENFNYPYIADSVSEFWRRWHISLGSWFRDYVYIPMGGNRRGIKRTLINLGIVWILTGLWHGAQWSFIFWGLYFCMLILLEKFVFHNLLSRMPKGLKITITLLLVLLGWVLFRAPRFLVALEYYAVMFGLTSAPFWGEGTDFFLYEYGVIFIIAAVCATPWLKHMVTRYLKPRTLLFQVGEIVGLGVLLYVSTSFLVVSNFNPFIYFNF